MGKKLNRLWATKTKNDEWWSSFVTAPLAILLSYLVVDIKWLTPNKITLFSFITALVSVVFIIMGGLVNFIIAAILIQFSHILDCMDGQIARYRKLSSKSGSYFDKLTDQIQVILWFGAIGYAAYSQTQSILPILLAFIGVTFYSLRGYSKYVSYYIEMNGNKKYLLKAYKKDLKIDKKINRKSYSNHDFLHLIKWFIREQRKVLYFDEGVFIFMLSIALIFNIIVPMLWVFAISQVYYGLYRSWQRGIQLYADKQISIKK